MHGHMKIFHSEVSKRGWRTEGVGARKSFLSQRFRPLFCALSYAPLREGGENLENNFGGGLGRVSRQPPPANPFCKPLIHVGAHQFPQWLRDFRELWFSYRELREWPFHSKSAFPEIVVVPRLLTRDSREVRDVRVSRDSLTENTRFIMSLLPQESFKAVFRR